MKVYIIGNGPSAIRRKLGKIIDAGDVVVRINNFQIGGFAEYVGTKTDILFTCRLNEYLHTIRLFPEVVICLLLNPFLDVEIPKDVLNAPNISEVIYWSEVNEMTRKLGFPGKCYPSTGLLCILKMIKRFGLVHILGFDSFKTGNLHYFKFGDKTRPPRHSADFERSVINNLVNMGFVRNLTP